MKKVICAFLLMAMVFSLVACSSENNPISKRYTEDRSSQMEDITISDEKFEMYLSSKIIPLCSSVNTLSMQAQQLKMGVGNKQNEITRVETILTDMQSISEELMDMNVSETKQTQKQNVLDALNNLEIQLTSYKTLLSSENITQDDIQNAMDIITSALDTVKQATK